MKKIILTTVTYLFACFLGLSFYFTLYKLFTLSPAIGLALISAFVFSLAVIIHENKLLRL